MRKILQEEFTKKGVKYQQLEKNDTYVLYQCKSDGNTYYELFRYKVSPYPKMFDNPEGYDEFEVYPSTEMFGSIAWCCSTLSRVEAMKKKHFS